MVSYRKSEPMICVSDSIDLSSFAYNCCLRLLWVWMIVWQLLLLIVGGLYNSGVKIISPSIFSFSPEAY